METGPTSVTLVLSLHRAEPEDLMWVRTLQADPRFGELPMMLAYSAEAASSATEVAAMWAPVLTVALPSERPVTTGTARAYARLFDAVTTPYVMLLRPRPTDPVSVTSLGEHLTASRERVDELGLRAAYPLVLHTPQRGPLALRAYLWAALRQAPEAGTVLADYLGYLAMLAGGHTLESIDPTGDGLAVHARTTLGRFSLHEHPPWRYRIAIMGFTPDLYTDAETTLSTRVDSLGVWRWENLSATLPMERVPDGNHRVRILLDSPHDSLRISQSLTPSSGLLASARATTVNTGPETHIHYLAHARGNQRQTWITTQHSSAAAPGPVWTRTMLRKDIGFVMRGWHSWRMRFARLVRLVSSPVMGKKQIWLIGERENTAQDNGMHLFRYLRTHRPDAPVYYVIDQDSPQRERIAELGNLVAHSSIAHQFLMLHATVLANAYSVKHMIPRGWHPDGYVRHLAWRVGALRVYLKHGVHLSPELVKRGSGGYDLYLTVNPMETAAFKATSGYDTELVETGLPRYDALEPVPGTRTILFMPTWRRYLVPKLFGDEDAAKVEFAGSTYETFMRAFLTSPRLANLLERHDYRLRFLPHYNLQDQLASMPFDSERITLADPAATPFQDLLRECDGFITDYSSVHFDIAYLGTPIIYSQFDSEEYTQGHAGTSWFDFARDGFGPVTSDVDSTLDALADLLARDCAPDPAYTGRVERAFTHHDRSNCARVVHAIDDLTRRTNTGGAHA